MEKRARSEEGGGWSGTDLVLDEIAKPTIVEVYHHFWKLYLGC